MASQLNDVGNIPSRKSGESSQDSFGEDSSASRGSNVSVENNLDRIHSAVDIDTAICSLGDAVATIQSHARRLITLIRCPGLPSCCSESRHPPARFGSCGRHACRTSRRQRWPAVQTAVEGEQAAKDEPAPPAIAEPAACGHCVFDIVPLFFCLMLQMDAREGCRGEAL